MKRRLVGSRLRISSAWDQPTATVQGIGTYQAFDQFHSATGEKGMHGNHGEYSTSVREHSGHNRHAGHSVATFRDKFWVSLGLTIPVVVWSSEVQHWLGYHALTFPGSRLIPAILGTIILVYGGSASAIRSPSAGSCSDLWQPKCSTPCWRIVNWGMTSG